MRPIDADALKKTIKNERFSGWGNCLVEIDNAPTVDAVEVVRCMACKYYQKVYGGVPFGEVGHCICHSFETVPDWYCADGERRNDGND